MNDTYETLKVQIVDEIATITLNRPEVINAFNMQMVKDFSDCLESLKDREDVKVVVCKAAGDKGFSAGLDVKESYDMLRNGKTSLMLIEWRHTMKVARSFPKALIFQMHGYSLGAGFELALCGDFVIVSEDAKLGTPQINVGVPVELEGALIGQYCGMLRAKKLSLTGELIDGKEAERIGLVTEAVPLNRLEARVKELAKQMAEKDPRVVAAQKEDIYMWMTENLQFSVDHSILVTTRLLAQEGALDRMRAFMERTQKK